MLIERISSEAQKHGLSIPDHETIKKTLWYPPTSIHQLVVGQKRALNDNLLQFLNSLSYLPLPYIYISLCRF